MDVYTDKQLSGYCIWSVLVVSTYFFARSADDQYNIIDDDYRTMQVIGEVSGATFTYEYYQQEHCYYIDSGGLDATSVIWALSLPELTGNSFIIDYFADTTSRLKVMFYKPFVSGTVGLNNNWTKTDDTLIKKMRFLALSDIAPLSRSNHLAGLEIYNASGDVMYSSAVRSLNVLACAAPGTAGSKSGTNLLGPVTYTRNGVYILIGREVFSDREVTGWSTLPKVQVDGNSVTVTENYNGYASKYLRPGKPGGYYYATLGALIGEV